MGRQAMLAILCALPNLFFTGKQNSNNNNNTYIEATNCVNIILQFAIIQEDVILSYELHVV